MKSEISNSTLVVLLVGAMFVAMLSTVITVNDLENYNSMLTGYDVNTTNPNATLTITVGSFAHINFTRATIDFGSGYATGDGCDLYADSTTASNTDADCKDNWYSTSTRHHLVLENLGSINCTYVNVTHNASIDASVLIGGTSPVYEVGLNRESGAATCTYNTDVSGCDNTDDTTYGCNPDTSTMFVTGHNATVCDDFNSENSNDEIYLNFHLFVPTDATPGTRTDTWTAICYYT